MKQLRAIFFWAHLVAGSVAGLIILVLSLSGAALAFKPQILRAVDTAAFDITADGRKPLAASALAASVRDARPGESVRALTLQRDAALPASAQIGVSTLYLDPYTGAVLGESSVRAQQLFRTIENWHRWLAMSGEGRETGRAVTGVANVALLFLALSGVYLWWPRGWTLRHLRPIVWFKRASTGRARDFNWHNVVGLWMAPMMVVMTATGAVMSYPALNGVLQAATGGAAPAEGGRPGPERG
ncbi:MAG: PepSY-associated TM helix domain-containing protein, partial [Vicinamibacterales bacterium]